MKRLIYFLLIICCYSVSLIGNEHNSYNRTNLIFETDYLFSHNKQSIIMTDSSISSNLLTSITEYASENKETKKVKGKAGFIFGACALGIGGTGMMVIQSNGGEFNDKYGYDKTMDMFGSLFWLSIGGLAIIIVNLITGT